MNVFRHTGDLGDIIAALPAIRQLGGGYLVITEPSQGTAREKLKGERFEAIRDLLSRQPYIASVDWCDHYDDATHDLRDFRESYLDGENLAQWQGRFLGAGTLDTSRWLDTAGKNEKYRGRVIFARSARYHNGFYPWFALIKRYPDALFVGLSEEHKGFEAEFRCKIEYLPTRDLLELARAIVVSRLFCGNQSCPWWIACGLGVTTFQETWLGHEAAMGGKINQWCANSIVERPNAHYMLAPKFDLEKLPA